MVTFPVPVFYPIMIRDRATAGFTPTPSSKVPTMTHAPTRSRSDVFQRIALAGLLGAVLLPPPVGAQIPNVRRRATDAATRAAGVDTQPKAQCRAAQAAVFDSITVELNPARLERVMKALRARREVMDGRGGAPGWNTMVTRRDAAANAAADLVTRKGQEMDAYREQRDRIAQCRDEAFSEKRQAHRDASMQRAMSDPDFMQRMAMLSQQVLEAQQRGDTAAVNRLAKESQALLEGPTREDSLAVDRHCGQPPRPPASLVQYDSLVALQDTLNVQMQRRTQEADTAGVGASGMTSRQLAMAQERAEMFLAAQGAETAACGYTDAELAALKAKQAALDELL